jgi:hypothetical protein
MLKPYECLDWETQETLLRAAEPALRLAALRHISTLGELGPALAPVPYRPVPPGTARCRRTRRHVAIC